MIRCALLLALAVPVVARAECRDVDVLARGALAARVEREATIVHTDAARRGCPNPTRACETRTLARAGAVVLMGAAQGAYTCAMLVLPEREVVGWLPTSRLVPLAPMVLNWDGRWVRQGALIDIGRTYGSRLRIAGIVRPLNFSPARGAVAPLGEIDAKVDPRGETISFTMGTTGTVPFEDGEPGQCRVWMARRGPYLVARDNGRCGGPVVSFSGLYRRQ